MPYPLDDNGNIRVDFVWGNVPMQPDELRTDQVTERALSWNQPGDRGWTASSMEATSDTLNTAYEQGLSVGDQSNEGTSWQDIDLRFVDVPSTHDIIKTGYNNFPAFLPNYEGDGDIGLEAVVPDVFSMTDAEARAAIEGAGFVYASQDSRVGATVGNNATVKVSSPVAGATPNAGSTVTVTFFNAPEVPNLIGLNIQQVGTALTNSGLVGANTLSTAGATQLNNGLVKSQVIPAGTTVDTGTTINYVLYNYVVTANTNIAGFSISAFPGHPIPAGGTVYMFLFGRTTKPAVGNTITIANSNNSSMNRNWTVDVVEDNDSYNTGGTVVTMTAQGVGGVNDPASTTGATWVVA